MVGEDDLWYKPGDEAGTVKQIPNRGVGKPALSDIRSLAKVWGIGKRKSHVASNSPAPP